MDVRVEPLPDGSWAVTVDDAGRVSRHVVDVPAGYAEAVGCSGVADAKLVRASLAFLLEREPARSILGRFALDVIPRYFPDYTARICTYVRPAPSTGPA